MLWQAVLASGFFSFLLGVNYYRRNFGEEYKSNIKQIPDLIDRFSGIGADYKENIKQIPDLINSYIGADYKENIKQIPDWFNRKIAGMSSQSTEKPMAWIERNITLDSNVCINVDPSKHWIPIPVLAEVKSTAGSFYRRHLIRQTWGKNTDFLKLVFLVGKNELYDSKIADEHLAYGDIIQGDFLDTYKTYKTMMGLKWATQNCLRAESIMVVDENTFVHVRELKNFLQKHYKPQSITCKQHFMNLKPSRDPKDEYFISYELYPYEMFPLFCVGALLFLIITGLFVIYSPEVVTRIVEEAEKEQNYFHLDNVFFTGIIKDKLHIPVDNINDWFLKDADKKALLQGHNMTCMPKFLFARTDSKLEEMYFLWHQTEEFDREKERKLNETIL